MVCQSEKVWPGIIIKPSSLEAASLRLIIFCYQKSELKDFEFKFSDFNNVNIVYSETQNLDFEKFNKIILEILPKKDEQPVYKVEIKGSQDE